MTAVGYFAAYTYFLGYYGYFKIDLHILEFSLIENLLRSGGVFWVCYHGLITFVVLVESLGPSIQGILHKFDEKAPDHRPTHFIRFEQYFRRFVLVAGPLSMVASMIYYRSNLVPMLVGAVLGTLSYFALWIKQIDLKIMLAVIILYSLAWYMRGVGADDAMRKVAQKELSQVSYILTGSTEQRKSFLITRNQGNYVLLDYAAEGETRSRLIIRVVNEKNMQSVEFSR